MSAVSKETQELADRIRVARKTKKVSQLELAAAIGIDRSSLAKMELGRMQFTAGRVLDIAKFLNINPASLFSSDSLTESTLDLAASIDNLSEENKTLLQSMIKAMQL